MRSTPGVISAIILCLAILFVWNPLETNLDAPPPPLSPPVISEAAIADTVSIKNPFGTAASLPDDIPDDLFWRMITEFSEPGGEFIYENFLSNESSYQDPISRVKEVVRPGGVYLGVGPEQNFTYIAAIHPHMAFIVDIRRQNMLELLMYKALFAMAADRAGFISLLFSREPSARVRERATPQELFSALATTQPNSAFFERNLERIYEHLRLSPDDKRTVRKIYTVFFSIGPGLTYASVNIHAPSGPSYEQLMTSTDWNGMNWSYLASEENFRFIKEMQRKNLIVPIVGDFAGPKAIRIVGQYLKDHRAKVSAFYVSNVEMYILPSPRWKTFCANIAALPIDESSMFIRFLIGGYARAFYGGYRGMRTNASVISPMIDVLTGVVKGYPPSYYDLIEASQ